MSEARVAALFDLDRTLVTQDTASLFIQFERRMGDASAFDVAKVAWWMARYTAGLLDAQRVAEKVALGYRGKREDWMVERGERCYREFVRPHVSDDGRRTIERHRREGHLVAIVTSGTPYLVMPLARDVGVEHVVCSRMQVREGVFTGKLLQPLCYGSGKVALTRTFSQSHGFSLEESYFYSDSITDLPLLEAVRTPVVVNPDARLNRHARRKDWRLERWQ